MVLNRGRSPSIHKGQLNSPMLLPRSFFGFGVAVSSQPIGHDVDVLDDEWIPQHGDHSALDDGFPDPSLPTPTLMGLEGMAGPSGTDNFMLGDFWG